MALIGKDKISAMHIAFSGIFYNALNGAFADSQWDLVAQEVPSGTSENEYGWIRSVPDLEEELGEKRVRDLASAQYSIKNKAYSNLVQVKRDDLADDNIGIYNTHFTSAGAKAGTWVGKNVLKMLPRGITANGKCFDGQPYFSASHPTLSGSTYSNYNANGGSGTPWYLIDTAQPLKPIIHQRREPLSFYIKNMPTDDNVFFDEDIIWKWRRRSGFGYTLPQFAYCSRETLSESTFEAAIEAMMEQKDDLGDELDIMPRLLVVGPKNRAAALKILNAEYNANGSSNVYNGSMQLLVSHFVETIPS